jgi:hypothetical protein
MLGRAVNLYFITKYKNISTRKPKYRRAVMRIKEFILYGLILRIISYLTYIFWEIDNFVIKSDIFRRFFICKNILEKLSCYHDNYFRYLIHVRKILMVLSARRGFLHACIF